MLSDVPETYFSDWRSDISCRKQHVMCLSQNIRQFEERTLFTQWTFSHDSSPGAVHCTMKLTNNSVKYRICCMRHDKYQTRTLKTFTILVESHPRVKHPAQSRGGCPGAACCPGLGVCCNNSPQHDEELPWASVDGRDRDCIPRRHFCRPNFMASQRGQSMGRANDVDNEHGSRAEREVQRPRLRV